MCIIQNGDDYVNRCQDNHEFFVCTHKHHPFPQDSERVGARPPAAWVSILYFQGADKSVSKILDLLVFAIPKI